MILRLKVPMGVLLEEVGRNLSLRVEIILPISLKEFYQTWPAICAIIGCKIQTNSNSLHGPYLVSVSRGCIKIHIPVSIVSVGYGEANMKCYISSTSNNHFEVHLIGHAAHACPDKEQPFSSQKILQRT